MGFIFVGRCVDGQLLEGKGPLSGVIIEQLEVVVPLEVGPKCDGLVNDLGIDGQRIQLFQEGGLAGSYVAFNQKVSVGCVVDVQHLGVFENERGGGE